MVELTLGAPVTLTYPRFGLDFGKSGQVIGLSIDWSTLLVKVDVLVSYDLNSVSNMLREDGTFMLREDGTVMLREA